MLLSLDFRTLKQLRTYDPVNDPPNAWEQAWIFFDYKDRWHLAYFYLGTNNFELGKKDNETQAEAQIFLATGSAAKSILGQWRHVDIQVSGQRFIAAVDGKQVVDYVNDGSDGKLALSWQGGKIGLYAEDAEVEFDNVFVTPMP